MNWQRIWTQFHNNLIGLSLIQNISGKSIHISDKCINTVQSRIISLHVYVHKHQNSCSCKNKTAIHLKFGQQLLGLTLRVIYPCLWNWAQLIIGYGKKIRKMLYKYIKVSTCPASNLTDFRPEWNFCALNWPR